MSQHLLEDGVHRKQYVQNIAFIRGWPIGKAVPIRRNTVVVKALNLAHL